MFLKLQKYSKTIFYTFSCASRKFTGSRKSDNDNVARCKRSLDTWTGENIRRRLSPFNIEIDFIKAKDREMDVEGSDNTREDCSSTPGKSFLAMFNVAFSIVLGVTYSHHDFFQLPIYGPKSAIVIIDTHLDPPRTFNVIILPFKLV